MSRLGPAAILQGMADALPTHAGGSDVSDLASSYEAIALVVHAYLAALGFKLLGFDQDKNLPEAESMAPRLPPQWNNGFGSLSFVYKHKQSSMTFQIRVDRMGTKVEVRGLAIGDENIHRFERPVRNVVVSNALPIRIPTSDGVEDRSDLAEKLRKVFVSTDAIADILRELKVNIVQKLIPKLQNEGYIEEIEREPAPARETIYPSLSAGPAGLIPPGRQPAVPGRQPVPYPGADFPPPGFEDEHQMNRPGIIMPGRSPLNIGHDDLNPPGLGPHDPLRGSFVGGGLPRPGGGSGMHPTFDDPLFHPEGSGQFGPGQGFDPQAPPGARWDPTGPGGNPRFPGPGSGRGNQPFGGGGGGGNFFF